MKQSNLCCSMLLFGVASLFAISGCSSVKSGEGSSNWSLGRLLGTDANAARGEDDEYDVFGEKSPDRMQWGDLSPSRIGTTVQARFSGQTQEGGEAAFREGKEIYDRALADWSRQDTEAISEETRDALQEQFREAATQFEIAANRWPDSALEHDALFLQGEARFFADDYVLSNRAFEILLNKYSGSRQLDLIEQRRMEIAMYWLSMDRDGAGWAIGDSSRPNSGLDEEGRRILHRIRLDDPTGKLADDATLALANAFFEAGRYADAADAYEDLRQTYPGSSHQFYAHLFELKARLASYRGPNYDGTDLLKAEKIMEAMVRQFPNEIEQERDYLASEATRIRELLAERDWTLGQYYEKRGENRAAKFYYAKVTDNYDDTTLAGEADERIAALGGRPDVPAQKVPWIADLFPVKERNKPLLSPGNRESIFR